MHKPMKALLFGFLVWLIPFVLGFVFWPLHESQLFLFKTIMLLAGALVGMYFLIRYFKLVESDFFKEGILLGILWLILNLVLDLIFLVGMFGSPLGEYFIQTGLRYLMMPIYSSGIGYLLSLKAATTK